MGRAHAALRPIGPCVLSVQMSVFIMSATFTVTPDINAICQRMANEVHRDVLPGDSHVTAMESIKDEFGLRTSATTTPGLLKVMFLATASRSVRVQRRLLGLGTVPQQRPRKR